MLTISAPTGNERTVTEMAEYIERDTAIRALLNDYPEQIKYSRENAADCIRYMDAADVAPGRHGRWKEMHYEGGILDGTNFDRCSICGYERVFDDPALKTVFKYCPNCGAKMDGGAD